MEIKLSNLTYYKLTNPGSLKKSKNEKLRYQGRNIYFLKISTKFNKIIFE